MKTFILTALRHIGGIMKRILSFVLAIIAALGMTGIAYYYRVQEHKAVKYTLGMGFSGSFNAAGSEASQSFTIASVILDKDGRVVDCVIDCADAKISVEGGKAEAGGTYLTKNELGANYGMAQYSPIGKEWNEQAAHFASQIKGKNYDEVKALAIGEDGKATDAEVLSGCTVAVGGFKEAVVRAMEDKSATEFSSSVAPSLSFAAVISDWGTASAEKDKDGKAALTNTVMSVALVDGKVASAILDVAAPEASFNAKGEITGSSYNGTKRELGENYGMAQYSPIGKEWDEQAAHFCESLVGLDRDGVASVGVGENGKATDADIAAGCTVTVSDFVKVAVKAMEKAE